MTPQPHENTSQTAGNSPRIVPLTFYPRREQIRDYQKFPDKIIEQARRDIARLSIKGFLKCGGHFSPADWFRIDVAEIELIKEVAAEIDNEYLISMAAVVGNTHMLNQFDEKEGNYENRWRENVDEEVKVLHGRV